MNRRGLPRNLRDLATLAHRYADEAHAPGLTARLQRWLMAPLAPPISRRAARAREWRAPVCIAVSTETLERELLNDLRTLHKMVQTDHFDEELYRGLAGVEWHRSGGGHVTLSWKRAETIINEQRAEHGRPPLTLAQTGGEGEVDRAHRQRPAGPGLAPASAPAGHARPWPRQRPRGRPAPRREQAQNLKTTGRI